MKHIIMLLASMVLFIRLPAWAMPPGDITLNWYTTGTLGLAQPSNGPYTVGNKSGYCQNTSPGSYGCGYTWSYTPLINWHGYSSGSSMDYVNNTALAHTGGASFSYDSNAAVGLYQGYAPGQHRNPTGDAGYYLTTSNSYLNLNFNSSYPIKALAFEWGSVDPYNTLTIIQHDQNGHNVSTSYAGNQICEVLGGCFAPTGGWPSDPVNDIQSIVVQLTVPSTDPIYAIDFSSSTTAFEFDNLAWLWVTVPPAGDPGGVPAPEPGTLAMAAWAVAGVIGLVHRKLRLQ